MNLGDLIKALEKADPELVLPIGFTKAHSYRGYYEDLAFEPKNFVKVANMLTEAKAALGQTFLGYKGGHYEMGEYTDCWLAEYGCVGESIGPTLLGLMLLHGEKASK